MSKPVLVRLRRGLAWMRSIPVVFAALALLGTSAAQAVTSAAIVVDAKTGKVLYSSNADTRAYPASLTKIMTLYLLFEALDSGRITLSSRIPMSKNAAAEPPSKLGVPAGSSVTVEQAILALVTRSANDVATAIGEYLAGSESAFARQMTTRAHQLGMRSTTFRNANGLPNSAQVTTARDMAVLGRAIQDRFPRHFDYFKRRSFNYRGSTIANHNRLLGRVPGVDGIKTGYTRASGFNLVSSVNDGRHSVVAVVLGGSSGSGRDQRMAGLLDKYVKRASTGPRTVARILPAGVTVAVHDVPTPRSRPSLAGHTDMASMVAAATTAFEVAFAEENGQGDISLIDSVEAAQSQAMESEVPPALVSGWRIQIAATPTEDAARSLLEAAQAKAPGVLGDASAYTEPVVKDSITLHRARFAGFADRQSANAACIHLKKMSFACYAIAQ